jgi:pimeloyl-ACP methyl ester carboxylesterase
MNRTVLLIDPRGQGKSKMAPPIPPSTSPMDITTMQLATDVFEFVLHMQWKEFEMMGFDVGAIAALQLGILLNGRNDVKCTRLILASTCPLTPSRGLLRPTVASTPFKVEEWFERCLDPRWLQVNQKKLLLRVPTDAEITTARTIYSCR